MFNISNSFGQKFIVTDAGESHGKGYVIIIEGVPPLLDLNTSLIQKELNKRRPGTSEFVTQRKEKDKVEIISGTFEGKTTGMPISLFIANEDHQSKDYNDLKNVIRPGHADYSVQSKFGIRDHRGGGRSSARQTLTRVAAAAVAQIVIKQKLPELEVISFVNKIGNISQEKTQIKNIEIEPTLNTLDTPVAQLMKDKLQSLKVEGDSVGSEVKLIINKVPAGIGGTTYSSLKANLSFALFSIPAVQAVEFGSGILASSMTGSQHNDEMILNQNSKVNFLSHNHGGILGGISTGSPIEITVTLKAPSSIGKKQKSINTQKSKNVSIEVQGRHDPCLGPRFCPVAQAMLYLTIVNYIL